MTSNRGGLEGITISTEGGSIHEDSVKVSSIYRSVRTQSTSSSGMVDKSMHRHSLIPIRISEIGSPSQVTYIPHVQGLSGPVSDPLSNGDDTNGESTITSRMGSLVHDILPNTSDTRHREGINPEFPCCGRRSGLPREKKLQISLRTFFVCGFLLFILALGFALIGISYAVASETSRMQQKHNRMMRNRLFELVDESNGQLVDAAEDSFSQMMSHSAGMLSREIGEKIDSLAYSAVFSVYEMARLLSDAKIDPNDLDRTVDTLWNVILRYPTVSMINYADTVGGNFAAIGRLPGDIWEVELQNTSAKCSLCQAGARPDYKYYYHVKDRTQDKAEWHLALNKTYDATVRPWYTAAEEGDGVVNWAPMRIFSSGASVGTMATLLIKAEDGTDLAVIGSDIDVSILSIFLHEKRAALAISYARIADTKNTSAVEDMMQFLVLDANGIVLGQTHHGESKFDPGFATGLQDAHYTKLFPSGSRTRKAVELIVAHFNGQLAAVMDIDFTVIPQLDSSETLVTVRPFRDAHGLEMIIVTVTEKNVYRALLQRSIDNTSRLIAQELNATTLDMDRLQDEVWASTTRNSRFGMVLCALIISVGAAFMVCFTNHLTASLRDLAAKMGRVSELDFTHLQAERTGHMQEITRIGRSFHEMMVNLQSFARYVPDTVTRLLVSQKEVAVLGVAPQEVSIMFSDIAGFTTIAETLEPDLLISLLAEYLDAMSDCIQESNGTVGKYIGDGMLSFWNSPFEVADHTNAACASALRQQHIIATLRERWLAEGLPAVHARIGISVGSVLHGNIGSRSHMEWGLIGDEVNLASRLEAMCKQYGVSILISDSMYHRVNEQFLCRHIDKVVAVGKSKATEIYELFAHRNAASPDQSKYCEDFGAIVQVYRQRQFQLALEMLERYYARYRPTRLLGHVRYDREWPQDKAVEVYRKRCEHMIASPPDEEWDGTFVLTEK